MAKTNEVRALYECPACHRLWDTPEDAAACSGMKLEAETGTLLARGADPSRLFGGMREVIACDSGFVSMREPGLARVASGEVKHNRPTQGGAFVNRCWHQTETASHYGRRSPEWRPVTRDELAAAVEDLERRAKAGRALLKRFDKAHPEQQG